MRWIILLLFLSLIFACRFAPATAESSFRENDFRKTIDLCTAQIEKNADDADAYFWRARANLKVNEADTSSAIGDLEKAADKEPQNRYYMLWLARAYEKRANQEAIREEALKYVGKALNRCHEIIKRNPSFAEAYLLRGRLHMSIGKIDKAKMDFEKALVIDPTLPPGLKTADYYHALGQARFLMKDYKQAVSDFDRAVELDPFLAPAYHDRAIAYDLVGYSIRALDDFNRAIELSPTEHRYYGNRAGFYITLGLYDKAIADAGRAIAINPDNDQAYRMQGLAYIYTGQAEKAQASIYKSLGIDEEHPCNIETSLQLNTHGLHYLTNLCLRFPEDVKRTKFGCYNASVCYEAAEKIAGRGIAKWKDEEVFYLDRAFVRWQLKELAVNKDEKWKVIIEDLKKAVETNPGETYVHLLLGDALKGKRQLNPAIDAYKKAIELEPQYAVPYIRRGEIYLEQGDYAKAEADFLEAKRLALTAKWRKAAEKKIDAVKAKLRATQKNNASKLNSK